MELSVTWQETVHKHGARVDVYVLAAYYQIEVEVDTCREVEQLGAQRQQKKWRKNQKQKVTSLKRGT